MDSTHRDCYYRHGIQAPLPISSSSSPDPNFLISTLDIVGILTRALLLLCYYAFVAKCCLNWHRLDVLRRFLSWRIRRREDTLMVYSLARENRGLDESVIRAIPTFQFRTMVGEEDGIEKKTHECAVCLNEFQDDERLRHLPNCAHAFHVDCIDPWLQSNANCPLCRSSISNTSPFLHEQLMVQNPYQDTHQNTHHLIGGDENAVIEGGSSQDTENSTEISSQSETAHRNQYPRKMEQRTMSKKTRKFHHTSSMGDECVEVRSKDDQFSANPIRRSFSMDSSSDTQLFLSVQEILQQNTHLHEVSRSDGDTNIRIRRSFFSFGHIRGSRNSAILIQFDL